MQSSAIPQRTLIDTDIGDDIDDAFALALATQLPELHLVGVTTVAGPVEQRAALARTILDTAGVKHVPVVAGSSTTLNGQPGSPRCSHCHVANVEYATTSKQLDTQNATTLITKLSHEAPLILIALGPLTNIARALQHDPRLAQRARLVAMGGKLGVPYPDWNIRCDPQAARVVLNSGMPITFVGMHLTMRCKLRPEQMRAVFANPSPLLRLLARCVLAWRTWHRRMPILHDALTVAVAARPTLVRLEPQRCAVAGMFLRATRSPDPNALVATHLDVENFHALLNHHLFSSTLFPAATFSEKIVRRIV